MASLSCRDALRLQHRGAKPRWLRRARSRCRRRTGRGQSVAASRSGHSGPTPTTRTLPAMSPPGTRYTTKQLTHRTWGDFERLFTQGNGWDHCWCLAYQGGNRSGRGRAERSVINQGVKRRLVANGRAHGVLVYAGSEPVGWCQFGPHTELPIVDDGAPAELFPAGTERLWRITCFVTLKSWQHRGVARAALRSALRAIRRSGGGLVEAYPFSRVDPPPVNKEIGRTLGDLARRHGPSSPEVRAAWIHREGTVTYEGGKPLLVEHAVDGAGRVNALCRWWGPAFHVGTVTMFEREGFKAVGTLPPPQRRSVARTGADDLRRYDATRVVMQMRL